MFQRVRVRARRTLVALVATSLALATVGTVNEALTSPAGAATAYTVNSTTDATGSGLCATPTAQCTLRAAVAAANSTTGATINVPAGTFNLSQGALTISKPMTIVGARRQPGAAATTIDGSATNRIFVVASNGVTIDGVVVRNGKAPNSSNGGGIVVNKNSNLTLTKSTVSGNNAGQGAGVEVDGTATIDQSTLTGNTADGKGGGLFSAGTSTVQNSTFDGNTAKGGGGIASSATVAIVSSTITANNSNNSNGGGLYRVGGSFNVTGSIVAANNASSGRDCYGSPSFSGTNVLQYTPGCNPSGGNILVLDPMVGALADNGGPTVTRRPLPGSAAINVYNIPCATSVDQRGTTRPQPAGGKCDVGAVEVAQLGLDLSLTTNTDTIPAGASSVRIGDIPPSALLGASGSTTDTSFIRKAFIRKAFIRKAFIRKAFIRKAFIRKADVDLAFIRKAFIRKAFIRKAVPLTDVTLTYPGGWDAIFLGTALEGAPINTLTLEDALQYLIDKGVTLDQIDIPFLNSMPFPSWLLSDNPLAHVPLTPALRNGSDQDRLNAWCVALRTDTQDPCSDMGVDPNASPASGVTLFDVSYNGYSIENVAVEDIVVRDIVNEAETWFKAMPLSIFNVRATTLGTIPVSALPAGFVDCTKVTCSTANLGQASQAGAIIDTKTLFDLFTDPGTAAIPQLATFNLADLYEGLFPPEELPWDLLDLDNVYLQNAASPKQPKLTYTMTLTVKGDRPADVNVAFQLPAGFDTVRPGSLKVDGSARPDPAIDANNLATLALGTLSPGVHSATLDTYAGLVLGPATATANATATAGTDTATAQASKTVTVVESFENGATDPGGDYGDGDTVTIQPDNPTLYLAQLSTATDRDLYKFTIPNTGNRTGASVILGNLSVDTDMVLYGPQPPLLRNPPQQTLQPVNDLGLDTTPSDDTLAPDTVQDVPIAPPSYAPGVVAVSANRGLADEEIRLPSLQPGQYAIQISGYNGAHSNKPYSLRMQTTTAATPECAAPPQRNSGATGPLTAPVTLGPNPHVLFVVPQQRMFATYGAGRAQPVIDHLQSLAGEVGGTILPVDNAGSAVAQKFSDWDANRCSVAAANDVVREIGKTIDAARAANPNIDNVVLIGDDSLLPMARVPDRTAIGNEGTYGSDVMTNVIGPDGITSKSNELAAALLNGYVLTDDAYGTSAGTAVNEHELFVPDVALGRLVETPEDMVAAITSFLDPANDGTLDPNSANSAMVTGYDFMTDGAQQVASNLEANGKSVDDSLIGNSWSAQNVRDKLFGGSAPAIDSLNTHFDQSHLLPAQETNAQNQLDLFSASELTGPAHQGDLARRLLFSMGCHAGLSVSDVSLGSTTDWAQAITGANQGGVFAGNTGYGLGDSDLVALSERLMALYAQELDGTVTAGRALMIAKQQYLATTQVLNPYDEKVLQQVVFYGLPMYKLGGTIPATNQSVKLLSASLSAPESAPVQTMAGPGSDVTMSGNDPRTNLPVGAFNLNVNATPHDTPLGKYYDVNGRTITAQYRPIEPGTSVDVTQRDAGGLTKRAHGVLITGLTTVDHANTTPRYFRPMLDLAADEPPVTGVGDAVFPSSFGRVTTAIGSQGAEQKALLTAGQARDPQDDGTVTQRLFTQIGGLVEYAPTSETDFTAPFIATNQGEIVGSTAGFTVVTDGTARRAYVLYKTAGSDGAWHGVDLVPTPQANGTIRWWGGGPTNADAVEFATQAVDAAGNVAVSNNKVENFLASKLVNAGALSIALTSGSTPVNGWYHGPVTATVGAPGGATIQVSLDGGAFMPYPSGGVHIDGDGVHHLLATDNLGDFAAADVSIDTTAPTVSAAVDAGSTSSATDGSGNTWYDGGVSVVITGNDGVGGSGVGSITYSAAGAKTIAPTTINDSSSPPLNRSPVGTASTSVGVSADGTTTVTGSAQDGAANNSASTAAVVKIDTARPTYSCGSPDGAWHNADVKINCSATDAGVGLLNAADASFMLTTNVAAGNQTANASTNSRLVCDKLGHCATAGPITGIMIDKVPPTVSITTPANGASYAIGQTVLASYSCTDLVGGSGIAATNGCTGTVASGAAIDTSAGAHSFSVTARDAAGNQATKIVTYNVGYRVCLLYDPAKPQPMTGTVPVKLQLCDAAGNNLSSASIRLVATRYEAGQLPSPNWQGGSNTGFEFRFVTGSYIYNLDPTNPMLAVGSHTLFFVVKGTTAPEYAAPFSLK